MTTPLVEFIVQRRLDRERFRDEKKDERRRKDFEKKKQRELERLNKKREGKKKDDKMPTSAKGKRDDDQPPTNPIKVIFIEFVGEKNTVLSFLFFSTGSQEYGTRYCCCCRRETCWSCC